MGVCSLQVPKGEADGGPEEGRGGEGGGHDGAVSRGAGAQHECGHRSEQTDPPSCQVRPRHVTQHPPLTPLVNTEGTAMSS